MKIYLCRALSARLGTLHFNYTPTLATAAICRPRGQTISCPISSVTPNKNVGLSFPQAVFPRNYCTSVLDPKLGLWDKLKESIGFQGKLLYPKQVMTLSSYKVFICVTQIVNYNEVTEVLKLPDTFNSWFLITELHIWLCMVRLAQEGREGRYFRNCLVQAMWSDVNSRSKRLGDSASLTARREGIKSLGDSFYAALFSYDEGLMGEDRDLASSLWRILFEMRSVDPKLLEMMVAYVRKQVKHLDSQESGLIMSSGLVTFLPLVGDVVDMDRHNTVFKTIQKKNIKI
ncbi:hypothetical protein ScPMuIL_008432 [Solemya velum]